MDENRVGGEARRVEGAGSGSRNLGARARALPLGVAGAGRSSGAAVVDGHDRRAVAARSCRRQAADPAERPGHECSKQDEKEGGVSSSVCKAQKAPRENLIG